MGEQLIEDEPVFREGIHACDDALRPLLGRSIVELLRVDEADAAWRRAEIVQPLIFSIQIALARLWQSWGVVPDAVVGHSVGEIAAAHAAGALTLEQAALVVHQYSRLQQQTAADTGMATVELSEAELEATLPAYPRLVGAGENGPRNTLVSGAADEIAALVDALRRRGRFAARIDVDVAAHSPYVEPIVAELGRALAGVRPGATAVPLVTSARAAVVAGGDLDGPYFAWQLRQPVRFRAALGCLALGPDTHLIEIGPHPILGDAMRAVAAPSGAQVLASMRRHERSYRSLFECMRSLAGLGLAPRASAAGRCRASTDEARRAAVRAAVVASLGHEPGATSDAEPLVSLGLESLAAMRLRERLARDFDLHLSLASLHTANLRQLAALVARPSSGSGKALDAGASGVVEAPGGGLGGGVFVHTPPGEGDEPFALNEIQQAYFAGRQGVSDWGNAPTHLYLEFEGALDPRRLAEAWPQVLARHDALRLEFLPDGRQRVLERAPPYELTVFDRRGLSPEQQAEATGALRAKMRQTAPPLQGWPHFEICLEQLAADRTRLHVNFDMLIVDLHSIGVVFRDWRAFYEGRGAALPALALSLRDYMNGERALRASQTATGAALDYWRARYASLPPAPPLPERSSRETTRRGRSDFEHREARLPAERWADLRTRARREGLTPSGVLCAAFAEVVAYFSAPRFTLTLPCFSRLPGHPHVNELAGAFTSTVLLEVDTAAGATFVERARALAQRLCADLEHGLVSGLRIIQEMRAQRREAPSFPVVFTSGLNDLAPHLGWAGALQSLASQTSQVRLDCIVHEYDGNLILCWDSPAEAFPEGLLDQMFDAFRALVAGLAEGESDRWGAAPLAPSVAAEWRRCGEFNDTARPDVGQRLHDGALAAAGRSPASVAVFCGERALSHAELEARSASVAALVRASTAPPGVPVAIVMRPGWEQVVAAHGVSRGGRAYVPIDADLPPARLRQLLEDIGATLALTQSTLDGSIDWPGSVQRAFVDRLEPLPSPPERADAGPSPPEHADAGPARADDLAYIIYTSGSTGRPKGVMIEHASAANTCLDVNRRFSVGPDDRVLALSRLSFDLSVYDLFGVIAAGGAIVYPEPRAQRDPVRWFDLMRQHRVTIWNTTPALMSMLVEYAAADGRHQLPDLRLVLLSGDWIPLDLPARVRALAPRARIVSLGGATEASIWSIYHEIERIDPAWPSVPYGRPLANQRFYVLDAGLRPCPPWVTGELYIGGAGVARGYWRAPDLTSARFVTHPETGERLYRTGDLGRWTSDGWIQFQGRADRQVKLRGHRIELGEIDAALKLLPDVAAAHTALYRPAADGPSGRGGVLVAYVVAAEGAAIDAARLREHAGASLPGYMVPTHIVTLDALPLTDNGKIDQARLPPPHAEAPARSGRAPATPAERAIAELWSRLLGTPQEALSARDHFFDLGGNSLLVVQLHRELGERYDASLDLVALFEHSTIEDMARLVEGPRRPEDALRAVERARSRARRQAERRRGSRASAA
jgi:amino acid adenylation domain-containing protein